LEKAATLMGNAAEAWGVRGSKAAWSRRHGRKGFWTEMDMRNERDRLRKWGNLLENLAIVVLAFYPLRHMDWGLDLWDTGYNYANFRYIGAKHMDSMWLFSTYLANVAGNWLTGLPNGDTLMGMNLYTGLFASALALMGYFFCTRKLKMPKTIVFLGEMVALSLCWCPTALLYNYLTYLLFLISTIFLYQGLTKERKGYFVAAGAFLGANVLVRFSNLPEMGMILAVWAYDFIACVSEKRQRTCGMTDSSEKGLKKDGKWDKKAFAAGAGRVPGEGGFWRRTARHTLWCLLGYAGALAALLSDIHLRYGFGEYAAGISRLFAMTDNAADYKPAAMILGILGRYREELYWMVRMGAIAAGGTALFALAGWLEGILCGHPGGKGIGTARETGKKDKTARPDKRAKWEKAAGEDRAPLAAGILHTGVRVLWILVSIAMIGWLYRRGFLSFYYFSYDSIWHAGPIFLMLAMLIAGIRILDRNAAKEEKLIGGMVILIILLTPIGSNNGVLPSLNNLFLAGPYVLWESWRFLRHVGEYRTKGGLVISAFPAKGVLTAFLAICLFQFGAFGANFAFAEGTGIQDAEVAIDNNPILRNIKMSPERARWMEELSAYANEDGLQGQEVILYGDIPSISYYLAMPSAFNPWSDLDSYSLETMERDMAVLGAEVTEKGRDKPVIILEHNYALYEESLADGQRGTEEIPGEDGEELSWEKREEMEGDPKWKRLLAFMDAFGYEQTFHNGKFAVYR